MFRRWISERRAAWTAPPVPLHRRIILLRRGLPLIVLSLAAFHQLILYALLDRLPPAWHGLVQLSVYGLTGIVVAWIGFTWLLRAVVRQEQAEADLRRAYADLEHTHQQLRTIHAVGRRIANASDEQELLEIAWGLSDTAAGVLRCQMQAGLSSDRCAACRPLTARFNDDCPLLKPLQQAGCPDDIDQVVCLPMGHRGERVGVVVAYLKAGTSPSAEQLDLLNILATEITAALEGVRLRTRQMATLYAVDRVTQEHHDLDALLERVLTTTLNGWGAQAGAILLVEDTGGTWNIRAHQGLGDDLRSARFGLVLEWAEKARSAGQPLLVQEEGVDRDLTSVATVLLQTEGETLGALFLGANQPGTFTTAQADLLTAVAHQIALAVRNAQLYSRLRQMAVLEERYRLSREMHDGLAQMLGHLGLQAERLERLVMEGRSEVVRQELKELRHVIAEAYLDVREAIDGLRLVVEQPGDLVKALQVYVEDFARRTGLAVEYTAVEELGTVPPEVGLHLLRIAQEALTNVRRHAQARRVWVQLTRDNGYVELTVADDGRGFDQALPQGRRHLGLASMRERAQSLDGQFTLATSPGRGTRVTVRIPLPESFYADTKSRDEEEGTGESRPPRGDESRPGDPAALNNTLWHVVSRGSDE
ncbi:MAG: GAF domain-containing sensor histidine kinase [Nitrospinota bacterium]|nr:MAG: GAF domain-containing sensor histidine kinase [Nitrospinota bacterium]